MKRILKTFGILLLLFCAVIFLDIGCMIKYVTGIPCPGCGTTRACIRFLQGDIVEAFYWHPLFWLTVLLLCVATLTNGRMFRSTNLNRVLLGTIAVMYVTVYIVRMVMLFPNTPPMDLKTDAFLWKAFAWIKQWLAATGLFS